MRYHILLPGDKEEDAYLDSNLLLKIGNRFFLSDPRGMELSNQILISMFRWWEKINSDKL